MPELSLTAQHRDQRKRIDPHGGRVVQRIFILGGLAGLVSLGPSADSSADTNVDAHSIILTSGEYRIVNESTGQRVEMVGFGQVMAPGKPMLPAQTFSVLLPPGARVVSLEAIGIGTKDVPGRHRISPTPPMLPLTHSRELLESTQGEWEVSYRETYESDRGYPEEIARVTGSGTLRKYSYVSVSFCPFTYHALSGRLIHHDAAQVLIRYSLPIPGSEDERVIEELRWDTTADERASELFVNYEQMRGLYHPAGPPARTLGTHDYVIVTHADLLGAITSSSFSGWKESLGYGVATVLITDAEITTQPGRDLAEQIRNFLRAYYGPWGIQYVLLVGNYVTIPMRYCFADPGDHSHNPGNPGAPGGSVPTDHYYADLSFPDDVSWDADGDGFHGEYGQDAPDFLAEVSVGRIPTNVQSRVTYALDKLVAFEQDAGPWKRQALHGGAILFYENQDHMVIPFRDGAVCLDLIENECMSGWSIEHFSEQSGLCPSTYPWPPLSQASFTTAWRDGQYAVVNWAGHGSPDGAWRVVWEWDDGDGVPETDGSDVFSYEAFVADWVTLEDDYPSIVFAVSCNVGYPEPNNQGRLGVDLLTKPVFGASAGVISASRVAAVTGDWPTTLGGAETICCEFNRHLIMGLGGPKKVGDALYDAKYYSHTNYGWDHFREFWNLYDYNLYGDPSLAWQGIAPTVDAEPLAGLSESHGTLTNHPNPFNPATQIGYSVTADGWVRLEIFNIQGRRVATLVDEFQTAGRRGVRWDGRSREGDECPSGIYFVRVRTGGATTSRSMVLMR
jgi:hypothetical protein